MRGAPKATIVKALRPLALLAASLAVPGGALAVDAELDAKLRSAVEANLRGYNAEDAKATLAAVHEASPEYEPTKAVLEEQFRDFDITATLVDFRTMGHDDEFVVARVKTRFESPDGSGLNDNVVDSIMLFHQEGGVWKLWSDEILGVEFQAK